MNGELGDLYPHLILDHGRWPRNRRVPAGITHSAAGDNPLCGDQLTVYLQVGGGYIRDIGFQGNCCALATASASLMTEAVMGCDPQRAIALHDAFRQVLAGNPCDAAHALGALHALQAISAFRAREQCASLAWQALVAALAPAVATLEALAAP